MPLRRTDLLHSNTLQPISCDQDDQNEMHDLTADKEPHELKKSDLSD